MQSMLHNVAQKQDVYLGVWFLQLARPTEITAIPAVTTCFTNSVQVAVRNTNQV